MREIARRLGIITTMVKAGIITIGAMATIIERIQANLIILIIGKIEIETIIIIEEIGIDRTITIGEVGVEAAITVEVEMTIVREIGMIITIGVQVIMIIREIVVGIKLIT